MQLLFCKKIGINYLSNKKKLQNKGKKADQHEKNQLVKVDSNEIFFLLVARFELYTF